MYDTPDFNEEELFEENYEQAAEMLEEPDKVEKLLNKMTRKLNRFTILRDNLSALPIMGMMVNSYIRKKYTKVPVASIVALIASIAYFVLPVDVIPDFIPVVGFLDDIGIIGFALSKVKGELDDYMDWRIAMGLDIPDPLTD